MECYAPEKVILFGSLSRGDGRWDSDADILAVMPFEGRHLAKIREMRRRCQAYFPLDLLVRRLVGRSGVDCQGRGRLGSPGELLSWRPSLLGRMRWLLICLQNHLITSA
ncbi:nucleotidyltransferase domain-containing protein [Cyanobium sp. CH-040]|uniref:nucleotidyltransferase domain-containing protein n=1 Tax=Cyanobium sp. CH-040 TaxID=2823708 RepID=UPI0037BEE689